MAPKFSEIFSFLTILKQSIQILPKIWKFLLPITVISLALISLVVFIFTYTYQTVVDRFTQYPDSDMEIKLTSYLLILILLFIILLAVEFFCLFIIITASNISGTSTVLATAACYTGKKYSQPWELFSEAAEKARRNPLNRESFRGVASKTVIFFSVVAGLLTGVVIGLQMINPVTVCLLFLIWVALIAFTLRSTAGRVLVNVLSVLEENCAENRSEQLIEGQGLEAYMLIFSSNLLFMVMTLVLWRVIGDRGSQNMMIYGVIWFNLILLFRVCISVVYTVFYFQCKKYHGEAVVEVPLLGDSAVWDA